MSMNRFDIHLEYLRLKSQSMNYVHEKFGTSIWIHKCYARPPFPPPTSLHVYVLQSNPGIKSPTSRIISFHRTVAAQFPVTAVHTFHCPRRWVGSP